MPEWRRTIHIKQHLDHEKPFAEVRDAIVAVLKHDRAYGNEWDQERHIFGDSFTEIVDNLAASEDVAEFDEWLSALYDWADDERVWIGGDNH